MGRKIFSLYFGNSFSLENRKYGYFCSFEIYQPMRNSKANSHYTSRFLNIVINYNFLKNYELVLKFRHFKRKVKCKFYLLRLILFYTGIFCYLTLKIYKFFFCWYFHTSSTPTTSRIFWLHPCV